MLVAIDAAHGRWQRISAHLPPIAAFLLGVGFAETVARPRVRQWLRRPTRVVLAGEIVVLLIVGALPARPPALVTTVAISFVAALQISTFNLLGDTSCNTTMVTGNLRTLLGARRIVGCSVGTRPLADRLARWLPSCWRSSSVPSPRRC